MVRSFISAGDVKIDGIMKTTISVTVTPKHTASATKTNLERKTDNRAL